MFLDFINVSGHCTSEFLFVLFVVGPAVVSREELFLSEDDGLSSNTSRYIHQMCDVKSSAHSVEHSEQQSLVFSLTLSSELPAFLLYC